MIREAMERRGGEDLDRRFRDFDTICNATQENQDAMANLVEGNDLDFVLVVGGYNSSNTRNLARIAAEHGVPTYHIEDAESLGGERIRYQPVGTREVAEREGWFPGEGPVRVGLSAGASTPDTRLAEVMARLADLAGVDLEGALGLR